MGNCCDCDCPCCCNGTDSEEDEKYPEIHESEIQPIGEKRNPIELEEFKSAPRMKNKRSWKRNKSKKHLKIDHFNKVATAIIKYRIGPYLFVYEQIALSRINKTFSKLFRMQTFDHTSFNQIEKQMLSYFTFLDEKCSKTGKCKFMQLTKHEMKLLLYIIIVRNTYDNAIHLWSSNFKWNNKKVRNNCHLFISNLVYNVPPNNKFKQITFSAIFNNSNNFGKYFIEPFSTKNICYKDYVMIKNNDVLSKPKFGALTVLNLDFNPAISDKHCEKLFTKCITLDICPNLELLNLCCTNIGDLTCRYIENYYKKNIRTGIKLNKLYLDDNYKITTNGVDRLNNVLKMYEKYKPISNTDTEFRLKNELNKRNWRLYRPNWDKRIITGYKPPVRKKKKRKGKGGHSNNRPASGGGSAF